jgi:hypothetical protein
METTYPYPNQNLTEEPFEDDQNFLAGAFDLDFKDENIDAERSIFSVDLL